MRTINTKKAFTLVELLIATGLLGLIIAAAFSLYTSTTRNFIVGSWRLEEQKRLQHLNSDLTRDLSLSVSKLCSLTSNGEMLSVFTTPIYINKNLYSENEANPKFLNVSGAAWQCLISFSIATQHIQESPTLRLNEVKGKWQGCALWAKNGKLKYLRTGDYTKYGSTPTTLPATIMYPGPSIIGSGLFFEGGNERNGEINADTSIEEIGIIGKKNEQNIVTSLEITTRSIRRENGKLTNTELTQKVLMKIATGTTVLSF